MELKNDAVSGTGGLVVSPSGDAKTLAEPTNGEVRIRAQESVVDQISLNPDVPDSCVVDASMKNGSSVVSEKKAEADLETDAIFVDEKIIVSSKSLEDHETGEEGQACGRSKPKLVSDDESKPETTSSSPVLFNGVNNASDSLPCKDSSISGHGNSDGSGNQSIEIDGKLENPKNVADLEPAKPVDSSLSKDQNVSDDVVSPAASRTKFKVSDLVWAKVRSYPWWPGQILDPSVASEMAKKYFKKGSYLIAYFGDQTFAWNDVSRIKPFREHFSQMENQSSSTDFHDAVDCALDEISRRVEYGLTCHCVSNEVFDKFKTQTIVNAGIQEESCEIEVGDSFSGTDSFEPLNLVEYVRSLACTAFNSVPESLKFVTLRAQLLSFHRWKGYPELPQFELLHGSLESASNISLSEQAKNLNEHPDSAAEARACELVSDKEIETVNQDEFRHNTKNSSEDEKEQTLADFIAEYRRFKRSRNESNGKSRGKSVFGRKKRKTEDSQSVGFFRKAKKSKDPIFDYSVEHHREDSVSASKMAAKPVFGVGASILKVASRLSGSNPIILKPYKGSLKNK